MLNNKVSKHALTKSDSQKSEISETALEGIILSDLAYERLRDLIIRVELAPGTPLQEHRLSESLGVGLTPVRNAIRRLSFEHLVTVRSLPRLT